MKKNIFLVASLLMIAICIPQCCGASDNGEGKKEQKDIAIQLYSVRDDIGKDYAGTIKAVGAAGYTAVETANYNDGKFYGRTPEEFKQDLADAGMTALSSHTMRHLSKEELEAKDFTEAMKWWDQAVAAHKAAGMSYIVCAGIGVDNLDQLKTYCEYFNQIGEKCKEAGLKFGYHNHDYELRNKYDDNVMYDFMIQNTNPESVVFEMDVYWVVRGGQSPVEYFNRYPGRFELLHVKDYKELGQSGMVGFDAIFRNTDVAGVKHLVVEVEQYNYTPIESITKSLDYLLGCPLVKKSYVK